MNQTFPWGQPFDLRIPPTVFPWGTPFSVNTIAEPPEPPTEFRMSTDAGWVSATLLAL